MGSCCSKGAVTQSTSSGEQQFQQLNPRKNVDRRERQWQATGQIVLRDANLKVLPNNVIEVGAKAKVLDLKNNDIKVLPDSLSSLTQLHRIILSSNRLASLGPVVQLHNLKILHVDNNKLTELPRDVGNLSKLDTLICSKNLLVNLPTEIGQLTELKQLSCDSNRLQSLPTSLSSCQRLVELSAASNEIQEVPPEYGQLHSLSSLMLDNNRIATIPAAVLKGCTALHTISLSDNIITMEVFQELEGYDVYEQRRRKKVDKQMAGGAAHNLNEGLSRQVA